MGKGTASMGRKSGKKSHIPCKRCGIKYDLRKLEDLVLDLKLKGR